MRGHSMGADQLLLSDDGSRGVTYHSAGVDPMIYMWNFRKGKQVDEHQTINRPAMDPLV